jgi:hypothetical protein
MFGKHSNPDAVKGLAPEQMFGPHYKLIKKIGEGGMGVVWTATQVTLERVVAIKVIRPGAISETDLARFETEAKLAAALDHHCIVPVHEFDKQDEQYFICMAFIKGPTLEERLKEEVSPSDAGIIVRAIADAIRYAHEKNIIHRDLKPLNILLNAEDAGSPRVTDFGLARKIDARQRLTAPGSPLGTAYYMSPEQALGRTEQIDKPTDVFSLGAILYYALTGCPPFVNLEKSDEPIESARTIKRSVPDELDSICRACLAINPNDRISARELTARLDDFLATVSRLQPMRPAFVVPQDQHVIICGLGNLGMRLAKEGHCRGKSIVAIEQNRDAIREARSSGIEVIDGDATDPAVLSRARVDEAEFVLAACQDDGTNVAIAAKIREVLPLKLERRYPLVCRLLLNEYTLRPLVANESFFPSGADHERSSYHINFGDLDLYDTAARQCLRSHRLDFQPIHKNDETIVHLVVAGFGPMGQSLALQAARIGHFANGVNGDLRLRVTVIDEADEHFQVFRTRYSKIDDVCELRFQQAPRNGNLVRELGPSSADALKYHWLVTYAICLENEQTADDRKNFELGLELSQLTRGRPAQTLIYLSTHRGFASFFPPTGRGTGLSPHVHAFGMKEDIYSWDVLLHESEDRLARALHEDFQQQRRNEGVVDSQNPDWDHLNDDRKESNRHAADHIPIKLRSLDYDNAPIDPAKKRVEQFTEDEIELLAQMEHARWCAERSLAGWCYGPGKQVAQKAHPCLVPWNELPPNEKIKDEEQADAIPRILETIGQGIYLSGNVRPTA